MMRNWGRNAWILAGVVALAMPVSAAEPKTDDEKTIYAMGVLMSQNLANYELTTAEIDLLKQGLTDGLLKKTPKDFNSQEYMTKIQAFASARMKIAGEKEKKESDAYLAKAAAEKGATKTESGLIYTEVKAGTGESPKATDRVKVHYHGTLRDGTVFDSSVDRGTPATFPLNGVIKCWTEGVQKMKVGGKSKLTCPAEIAYGERGAPPKIKPGAALNFDVELLEIVAAPPTAAPGAAGEKPAAAPAAPAAAPKPAGH